MTEADVEAIKTDLRRRMDGAVDVLRRELAGLRTGRASASLLDPIQVDAYGGRMPLGQVANVNVPDPRMLSVQVWDKSLVKAVEKAIRTSGLDLNPSVEGQLVRVPIPALTEERRVALSKVAGKYAEEARVAVRNVRRHGMDDLKRLERDGDISQDLSRSEAQEIQKLTDELIARIDEALANKEQDILQV